MTPLDGEVVYLRPGTTDAATLWDAFTGGYHLPPLDAVGSPRFILDLGSNIGLTIAHMACLFPEAFVLGVELEPMNAELARRNIAPWGERCRLLNAAVWTHDGTITFAWQEGNEDASHVVSAVDNGGEQILADAQAVSLNHLVDAFAPDSGVDYVKMDIEGAEMNILRGETEWAQYVRCIKVEVHSPYTKAECFEALVNLGFEASIDRRHWACVTGVRK